MEDSYDQVVWSPQSELDLDAILDFYIENKAENPHQHIIDILDATESLIFTGQWQVDEYDPSCRRIIVKRKFRVLYKVIDRTILITRVYSTKKDLT
jgi:plasmid stabilization system protein ParE